MRENNTCISFSNSIVIIFFFSILNILIESLSLIRHDIKEFVALMDGGIQVDDDITIDMASVIATAINISTLQTTVKVCCLFKCL